MFSQLSFTLSIGKGNRFTVSSIRDQQSIVWEEVRSAVYIRGRGQRQQSMDQDEGR